jgi:hypothetical protein
LRLPRGRQLCRQLLLGVTSTSNPRASHHSLAHLSLLLLQALINQLQLSVRDTAAFIDKLNEAGVRGVASSVRVPLLCAALCVLACVLWVLWVLWLLHADVLNHERHTAPVPDAHVAMRSHTPHGAGELLKKGAGQWRVPGISVPASQWPGGGNGGASQGTQHQGGGDSSRQPAPGGSSLRKRPPHHLGAAGTSWGAGGSHHSSLGPQAQASSMEGVDWGYDADGVGSGDQGSDGGLGMFGGGAPAGALSQPPPLRDPPPEGQRFW